MKTMLSTSALAATLLYSGVLHAQVKELVGTWDLVSSDIVKDGSKTETFGPNPKGSLILGADGHYALVFTRGDLPKVASSNRVATTPAESKAIAEGSVATFGTYTADGQAITLHIVGATFPNWTGAVQQRAYTLTADRLVYTSPGTTGVPTVVTLRRAQ